MGTILLDKPARVERARACRPLSTQHPCTVQVVPNGVAHRNVSGHIDLSPMLNRSRGPQETVRFVAMSIYRTCSDGR